MNKETTFVDYNNLLVWNLREMVEMKILNKLKWKKKAKEQVTEPCEVRQNTVESQGEETKTNENSGKTKTSGLAKFLHEVAVNVAGGLLLLVITAIIALFTGIYKNIKSIPNLASKDDIVNMVTTSDIEDMATKDDIKDMATQKDIETLTAEVEGANEKYDKLSEKYNGINYDIGYIKGRLGTVVEPNENLINRMNQAFNSYASASAESDNYVWVDTKQVIGRDIATGTTYTAEDLENETVIFSYIDENNNEVFFKGAYNENNQWSGNCIINKYFNGNLNFIMNADYESGKLVSYHQVFSYVNASNAEVWAVSSRTVEEDGNAGQTWTYFKEREWKKDFEKNYLKAENIINEEYFYNIMIRDLRIEGYYNGYTSDGFFNDENENAYMIKYTEDGYIRLVYAGNFVNGQPYDTKGNAWMISLGRDGEKYYYYSGKIDDTSPAVEDWQEISIDEAKKKTHDLNYEGSLIWYGEVI